MYKIGDKINTYTDPMLLEIVEAIEVNFRSGITDETDDEWSVKSIQIPIELDDKTKIEIDSEGNIISSNS